MKLLRPLGFVAVLILTGVGFTGGQGEAPGRTGGSGGGEAAATCSPRRPAPTGTQEDVFVYGDFERQYRLSIPSSYNGKRRVPLIVNLHGFGGTMQGQDQSTRLPRRAGRRGYVVVSPQGLPINIPPEETIEDGDPERAADLEGLAWWNFFGTGPVDFGGNGGPSGDAAQLGTDDVGFINALLDTLTDELCLDARRLYATGMSNGAGMATTLGCELGARFDAIAPVAGVNLTGACRGDDPVSVLAIHGDADSVVLYEGNGLMGFQLGNPSVPDRMQAWAQHNACTRGPRTTEAVTGVTVQRWRKCADKTTVELWTIAGWDHAWPHHGRCASDADLIDATCRILDFFDKQRR